ncbi:glycosyltransferase [Massilibacteroides sp.]|uniref:glycosyltransferase n=1 Tax=Massilibacteroides sp. TaxID=2034766 RepID=UPI002634CF88|nr:glycosyltransferase [Massilibacteroides sp.]MDD4515780.1 glycosyltransferase [Massilibacteroides sp.]
MENLFTFSEIELYIAGILAGLFLIQLLFLLIVYLRPYRMSRKEAVKGQQENLSQPPVTVIVYAKNESENLRANLPSLLTQDYPEYQVVVINDSSTDESEEVLKRLEAEYNHLYHSYIPEEAKYLSRRKLALTVGIKAAKYDVLLFTEANCHPLSTDWIKKMASRFTETKSIVLGYCSYGSHKGFLHKLIAYDNLITGLQYLSSALAGAPYTGNGRNLAYRKEEFFKHKGYYQSLSLHAGDDDLFVNEVATKKNTGVEYTPESITQMAKVERFSVWKEMKVSRAATRRYYRGWALRRYRFDAIMFFLFFIVFGLSVFFGVIGNPLLAAFGGLLYILLLLAKEIVFFKSAKMLQQKPILFLLPLLEIVSPLFNLYVRIFRFFRGKKDYTFNLQ